MSIYIDMHVLQTVPPSCVNRDDTGSPKTAIYGGTTRSRVSSQSWKHAMRLMFKELFMAEELASRTKNVVRMVMEQGEELDVKKVTKALNDAGLKINKEDKSDALFFFSTKQAAEIARLVSEGSTDKVALKKALKDNPSVDIALFGRMVANDPTLNYDAAAQVAHAISTHTVQNEYDYFTAVDDLQVEDNSGAGHLGTVEFNSATLYRYANVNASELISTLGKDSVPEVIKKFAKAFICSMPTGKENTFANRTLPSAVYITVRNDQPINLCGAFEKPISKSNEGFAIASEKKLAAYASYVYKMYASEPVKAYCIGSELNSIAEELPLNELLDRLENFVFEIME